MLTADQLDEMREALEDSLPDTAVLQGSTWTSDGMGGGTTTWSAAGTVPCRIAPALAGEGEVVDGGRVQPDYEYVVTLPADTSINEDMQLLIDSATYSIVSLRVPRSYAVSCRVMVKEVK